jgi:hypothetical protein
MSRNRPHIMVPLIDDKGNLVFRHTHLCSTQDCSVVFDPGATIGCSKLDLNYLKDMGLSLIDFNRSEMTCPVCQAWVVEYEKSFK